MRSSEFREIVTAHPFRPLRVHLGSGEKVDVKHRDFVLVSPSGWTAFICTKVDPDGDEFKMMDILLIEAVEFRHRNGGNGKGRRRKSA